MTLWQLKKEAQEKLKSSSSLTLELDVDCLLQFVLKKDKTWILLNRDFEISPIVQEEFNLLLEKRKTGFPIAYLTGKKEFYGYDFFVCKDVLIPKPDTEILVEKAIEKISSFTKDKIQIIDVCTGSGCVGLSVLKELTKVKPQLKVDLTLTDLSKNALEVAKKNYQNLFNDNFKNHTVNFINGDLLCDTKGYDVILSNPPYVPHVEAKKLLQDGRSEPLLALDGDVDSAISSEKKNDDGLAIIRRLIPICYNALNVGGSFFMESGEYQTKQVHLLFCDAGFTNVHIEKDLSGMERITIGEKV